MHRRAKLLRLEFAPEFRSRVAASSVPNGEFHRSNYQGTRRSAAKLRAEVLLPEDLPITEAEIEVFAALLDDAGLFEEQGGDNLE